MNEKLSDKWPADEFENEHRYVHIGTRPLSDLLSDSATIRILDMEDESLACGKVMSFDVLRCISAMIASALALARQRCTLCL